MSTKIKRNSLLFVAGLFVLCALCLIITSFGVKSVAYADSANPYLQVSCNEASKSGEGWNWQQEAGNGTLTLNNYNGQEISIGGVNNGKVDVVLVGDNKITITAPYGNRAFNTYNVSTLTFKGSGSLAIDFQRTATEQAYMYGIYMDGNASSTNNGNLMFDESCTVTVKVYGEINPPADNKGLSGGAIAGITIGSVAVAGIGGFAIFWFVVKKKSFADLIAAIKGLFKKK